MMLGNPQDLSLEPEVQEVVDAKANPPFVFHLDPEEGRSSFDAEQASHVGLPAVDERWVRLHGGPAGSLRVRVVRPIGVTAILPVVLYMHGAGWVFGSARTHDRLVRKLAVGVHAAVVFPEYTRAPEAQYPVANEQCYSVAQWIGEHGDEYRLDPTRIAVAGDSVGGNMAIALTLMAKDRGQVTFRAQVLFYPVTDARFDTDSYLDFAEGYVLTRRGMQWSWDQYTTKASDRNEITASPLRARIDQLAGLPPALVITAEVDVARDEGEAFAGRLRQAGVAVTQVRYAATIHDFVVLDALRRTLAARAAITQAAAFLTRAFDQTDPDELAL